jgi:hypothetical protein
VALLKLKVRLPPNNATRQRADLPSTYEQALWRQATAPVGQGAVPRSPAPVAEAAATKPMVDAWPTPHGRHRREGARARLARCRPAADGDGHGATDGDGEDESDGEDEVHILPRRVRLTTPSGELARRPPTPPTGSSAEFPPAPSDSFICRPRLHHHPPPISPPNPAQSGV